MPFMLTQTTTFPIDFNHFLYEETPKNCSPILYSNEHKQPYFQCSSPTAEEIYMYMNFTTNVYEGTVVYDYFNTAEFFLNPSLNQVIDSLKSNTFQTLQNKHFFESDSELKILPTYAGYSPYVFVTSVVSPTDPSSYAWSFSLDTLFMSHINSDHPYYLHQNGNSFIENISIQESYSACSFYTVKKKDFQITSSHFNFANTIEDYHTCSHSKMSNDSCLSPCHFATGPSHTQLQCTFYSPNSLTLLSSKVDIPNTNSNFSISISYSTALNGNYIFTIINDTTSEVLSKLEYPFALETSYETFIPEVTQIYNEFLSCYDFTQLSDSIEDQPKDLPVQKNSFIQSLLGV